MQLLVLALLLNGAALIQLPGLISGAVADPSGAAVPYATVRLEMAGRTVDEVRTGNDGRFQLKAEASGSLRVVVTAAGFTEAVVPVPIDSRDLHVTLQPAPFFEAVNVTSSRTELPRPDPAVTITV